MPPMKLDAPLGVGSAGGHGLVHYRVSEYVPGSKVTFRFDNSGLVAGWDGWHSFEVIPDGEPDGARHVIEAKFDFRTWLFWACSSQTATRCTLGRRP